MKFTQADLENISKNFKYIRLACGYKTQEEFAWALDPKEGKYPGFSLDMIKKYESGKYNISEQTVRNFSLLFLFSFKQIVSDDLSYLEPNSLADWPHSIDDVLSYDEMATIVVTLIDTIFPLFSTKKCLEDCNFSKAFDLSIGISDALSSKLTNREISEEVIAKDLNDAIELFEKTDFPESSLNIMSLIGRLCMGLYRGMEKEAFEKLRSKRYENFLEYRKDYYSRFVGCNNADYIKKLKKEFLDLYNNDLTACMKKAAAIGKYKDYVHYYLAVRYYYGFMDSDITRMSSEEMNSFGISLLDSLEKIGNKYAKIFNKYGILT